MDWIGPGKNGPMSYSGRAGAD